MAAPSAKRRKEIARAAGYASHKPKPTAVMAAAFIEQWAPVKLSNRAQFTADLWNVIGSAMRKAGK